MRYTSALYHSPLVWGSAEIAGRLMIEPPHNPGGGTPTMWHPPHPDLSDDDTATGAMVYEDPDGAFNSVTTNGFIRVRSDGVLLIVPPTVDPVFAGALWVDGSTLKVSAGVD